MSNVLTKMGKIRKKHTAAIYLDTSVLIDYYLVEGLDDPNFHEKDIMFQEAYEAALRILIKNKERNI